MIEAGKRIEVEVEDWVDVRSIWLFLRVRKGEMEKSWKSRSPFIGEWDIEDIEDMSLSYIND